VTGIGVVAAGLLAGTLHVILGPDHLAALAVLSLKSPSGAWKLGLRWGLGHASGVMLVATLAFLLRGLIQVDQLSSVGEVLVGLTLIGLGVWGLTRRRTATAPHGHAHARAAFVVGTLHGAAGTSHFVGILPSLALPSTGLAVAYLAAFGVATIVAMALFAGILGMCGRKSEEERGRRADWMVRAASFVSVAVGIAWIVLPAAGIDLS
jgi:hypothetical protein